MVRVGISGHHEASCAAFFLPWLTVGLLVCIFLLDLVTPQGLAVWLLYFPSMVFALLWKGREWMAGMTAAAVLPGRTSFQLSRSGRPDLVHGTQMGVVLMDVTFLGVF
jgi:hypothetical protein